MFELLILNQKMMDALRREDHEAFGQIARTDPDYVPLARMAFDYATQGITSLEEVMKVAEIDR